MFLPRHGKGHVLSPSDINYRANIDVLKRAGVTDLVSLSACGSFREDLPPGTFVLVDQFVDRTYRRESSFFGKGCVAHVSMAHPVSPRLHVHLAAAAKAEGIAAVQGGTYVCMEGPQFSSLAESLSYKAQGYSVIGMTNMPEAKLAREAEICYASVAMVTDFDCWHPDHDAVTVQDIIRVLNSNAGKALLFCLAMQFLGLYVASFLLIAGFMRMVGKIALWKSLLTAFVFTAVMFVTFDIAFDVIMPKGPLEAALGR